MLAKIIDWLDERAAIKKRINTKLGSRIVEEKSYKPYKPA